MQIIGFANNGRNHLSECEGEGKRGHFVYYK